MTDANSLLLPNTQAVSSDCLYNLKASSVRARSYRASIPPSNSQTFTGAQTAIFYIPCGRKNSFIDPTQTYLKFTVKNNDGTNAFFVDNIASSFINRLDIFHGSNMIDTIQQYNVLASYIKDFTLNSSESYGLSSMYGTSVDATTASKCRQGLSLPSSSSATFCIPLLSSIFSNCDKMLPIGQLYDDIRIELTWEANTQAICAAGGTPTWTVTDAQLMCQIIELSDEGMQQVESATPFNNPVYIHSTSYRHYVSTLPAGTGGTFSTLVPSRFASTKTLIMLPRRAPEIAAATTHSISTRFNPAINSYWWRIGGAMIPQKPVTLYNPNAGAGYAEGFAEIMKSWHSLSSPDMCGGLNLTTFNATDILDANVDASVPTGIPSSATTSKGSAGYTAGFAIAQELESFANRSDLLLSGMNTLSSQVFFECNLGLKSDFSCLPLTATTLDFYAQYDQILVIENGIMSCRF